MTRADRLMDLTDLLRGRDTTTVDELAHELGVSRRTLLRDLAALRNRGVPITGEAGPGGGVRLEHNRGVVAVHLSVSEVVAMWLAARLAQEASDLPWGKAASSGLSKLLASLPPQRSRALREICHRVIIGEPASAGIRATMGAAPPELLRVFEEAFTTGRGLGFRYMDRDGSSTARRIEPHGLLVVTPAWYVLAHDLEKAAPRMFRMDRITRPRVLGDVTFEPDIRLVRSLIATMTHWRPLLG
jgi:predicted DNA-binding transcriptional regulator YafY